MSEIIKLDWNTAMRYRPGMYVGDVDTPFVLLREAIDNSIDELYGFQGTDSILIFISGAYKVVADNGRGIPIKWDEKYNMTKTELACTSTHTGSKFDKEGVSIGLNGVGISATNALSSEYYMFSKLTKDNYHNSIPAVKEAWKQGKTKNYFYYVHFQEGNKIDEGVMSLDEIKKLVEYDLPEGLSTITAFIPDETIFQSTNIKVPTRNLSYIKTIMDKLYHRRIVIEVNGKDVQNDFSPFKYEFIKKVTGSGEHGQATATFYVNFECDKNMNTKDFSGSINSLVCDRGTHIDVVKEAYSEALKSVYGIGYTTVLNGIHINTILVATDVDFSSQTKERCTRIEKFLWSQMINQLIPEFKKVIKANDDYFSDHVARLNEFVSTLTKISTINKVKAAIGTVGSGGTRVQSKVPKSVRDASIRDREKAELFIVEGKSAAGSIINTRDTKTQAVFELKGVPLNSINKDLDELLDNEEMKALISAIGAGVNEYFDINMARYGKIIIAADADSDGLRIASMIAGMIAKKMTFLIKKGMVFILRSPLYIQGDKFIYPEDASELNQSKPYTRIKGLGELTDDQSEVIITNRDTRRLYQVTLEDVEVALGLLTLTNARKQLMIDGGTVIDPFKLGLWY